MKSSLEKFGRKLTMHKKDHNNSNTNNQGSNHLDELLQASKDMRDLRNCYDRLIAAAAAMTNSIFEFSESLHEMGTCLTDKTTVDADGESGNKNYSVVYIVMYSMCIFDYHVPMASLMVFRCIWGSGFKHWRYWTLVASCGEVFSVSLFWTGAVLCNTLHVIVSGMVFLVLIHGGREAASKPHNPLPQSLRYAVTTSFGSICYGSVFTAAIRTLRWEGFALER